MIALCNRNQRGMHRRLYTLQEVLLAATIAFILITVVGAIFINTLNFCTQAGNQVSMCREVALFRKHWRGFVHSQRSGPVRMEGQELWIGNARAAVCANALILQSGKRAESKVLPTGMSAKIAVEQVQEEAPLLVLTLSWVDRLSKAHPIQHIRVVARLQPNRPMMGGGE